jgi:GT2 family glycosyltransferase
LEDRVYPNINASYQQWIINNEPSDRQLEEQRNISRALTYRPLLSLIMPVYNTPLDILEAAIRSVIAQTYNHWELCIANGSADSKDIMEVLSSFEKNEPRIKVIHLEKNLGIAENTNAAIKLASGEFIGFLDHDDLLAPFALFELAKALLDHPNIDMFYSDEDKISADGQERYGPFFKPAFSPDYLRSINYMPHFLVIKKSLGDEIGWLNNGFDGAQDYDLVLRAAEKAMYIAHCPCILYHWRAWGGSTALSTSVKDYATRSGIHAIQDHLERMRMRGVVNEEKIPTTYRVIYNLNSYPLVSIIIPNKDHADLLQRCVYSILQNTSYRNIEIIIVENNSQEEITFSLYAELKQLANVRVIQNNTQPFNFSNINNYAAEFAKGKILLFMNNDLEVINSDWIERMLEYIQRPDIGIVGAKLYYPDNTLQHGGVIIGIGGSAGHIHKHASRSSIGYFGRLVFPQNLSAVTGACLMIKKSIFEDVGGFDPSYQLAFGDIDLCLKVRSKGYLIVWTPYAELYHHESKTRGYEDTPEKQSRFEIEKVNLVKHWKNFLNEGDPYYNPNLSLDDEDFLIEPYARSQHIRIMKGF